MQDISKMLEEIASRCMEQAGTNDNTTCRTVICEKCGEIILTTDDGGRSYYTECGCERVRRARNNLEKSGLGRAVKTMTFESYQARESWQQKALKTAQEWTEEILKGNAPWLFYGGEPGSGKTHLCTAACGRLLDSGVAIHYMIWPETARQLKACYFDKEAFDQLVHPLKKAPVLYIDDLLKTARSDQRACAVTDRDTDVLMEIINARVLANLPTIISTEWMLDELVMAEKGVFSRVYEMSRGYQVQIGRDKGRNWRMKGVN